MIFEEVLPRMRKGEYFTRRIDPNRNRIRVTEFDGTLVFVARLPQSNHPSITRITATDILADDWFPSADMDAEDGAEGPDAQRPEDRPANVVSSGDSA